MQLLFLAGVATTIGPAATVRFFMRRKNHKVLLLAAGTQCFCQGSAGLRQRAQGSGFYLAGVALVLWGWCIIGLLLEAYGFFVLFSGFFPTVLGFLRRLPGFGTVLDLPIFKVVSL